MIGKTILHYKILAKLGEGGMGVVYKARDTKLDRDVAIKFLPHHIAANAEERERFKIEAKAAAALNHPNIATIHAIEEHDGEMFIVMEFIDGRELRQLIIGNSQLPIDNCLAYATQIAEGLKAAHAKGVTHRDIKSSNIMVTESGQVKIMDFGLAKIGGGSQLTKDHSTLGTTAYMSPEQARGEPVDHRTDIWALGVVLYEMLTGQLPFRGEYEQAVIYSICHEKHEPIAERRKDVPTGLESIVNRALAKDRDTRYRRVDELLDDLARIGASYSGKAPSLTRTRPSRFAGGRTYAFLLGLLVVMLLVAIWFLSHDQQVKEFTIASTRQLTFDPGLELDPAISPDGKFIAYAAGPPISMNIYVRQIDGERIINLTENLTGHCRWPRWSPDGTRVSFQTRNGIYVVPALGGTSRVLIQNADRTGHEWSPDGGDISFFGKGGQLHIHEVERADEGKTVSLPDSLLPAAMTPAWSPDGTKIAFGYGNIRFIFGTYELGNIFPNRIFMVTVANGELIPLTNDNGSLNVSPVWHPDGHHLFYISDQDGQRDIYQLILDSRGSPVSPPVRLTTGLNPHTVSISADGSALVYSVFRPRANIWSIEIPTEEVVSIRQAKQITTGNQLIETADVSPDGRWLVFNSDRSGNQDIYRMEIGGDSPIQLTTDPRPEFDPVWSPDGSEIAFFASGDSAAPTSVHVIPADGGSARRVAAGRSPSWSPDGQKLAFSGWDKSLHIIARAADGKSWDSSRRLTTVEGEYHHFVAWSPDGNFIAYTTSDELLLISPDGGQPMILVKGSNLPGNLQPMKVVWSRDSKTLYFKAFDMKHNIGIWSVPATGGTARLRVRCDDPLMQAGYVDLSSDDKLFYFRIIEHVSDIWLANLVNR